MKRLYVLLVLLPLLVALYFLGRPAREVMFALALGWVDFLHRVSMKLTIRWDGVAIAAVSTALFTAGFHMLARWWYRESRSGAEHPRQQWRWRWTLAIVATVLLMFCAGISLVGVTHQFGWLATSEEPVFGTNLRRRYRSDSTATNFKKIGLAFSNYHDVYHALPPGASANERGELLHSWETMLLPFLNYSTDSIHNDVPWNAPRNAPNFKSVLPEFINPDFRDVPLTDVHGFGLSHYAANSHVLGENCSMKLSDMTDGASETILAGEVNAGFRPWGDPVNWRDPARGIHGGPDHFGGPLRSSGTLFLMADGSVRLIDNNVSPTVLQALSTPAAGDSGSR